MINFPDAPTVGQTFSSPSGTFTWDGVKWVPVSGATSGGILDAPSDGKVYGRLNAAWVDTALSYVKKAGDTMTGQLTVNVGAASATVNGHTMTVKGDATVGGGNSSFWF